MVTGQVGTPIAGTFAGPTAAAVFDLAMRASGLVALGLAAVNAPVTLLIARLWQQQQLCDLQAGIRRLTHLATAGAAVATSLLLIGAILLVAASGSHWHVLPVTLGSFARGSS